MRNLPPASLMSPFQRANIGAPVTGWSGILPWKQGVPAAMLTPNNSTLNKPK